MLIFVLKRSQNWDNFFLIASINQLFTFILKTEKFLCEPTTSTLFQPATLMRKIAWSKISNLSSNNLCCQLLSIKSNAL